MSYKQIHLYLMVDPVPTSKATVDYACNLARLFEAKLHVSSPRLKVSVRANLLGGSLVRGMAAEIEQSTAANAATLEAHLAKNAAGLGISVRVIERAEKWPQALADGTWFGRTSDLCMLGLPREYAVQKATVEEWIFASGRPCLLIPDKAPPECSFGSVVICWDFSRSAARAVADAIPILRRARQVRIVTARGEKDLPAGEIGAPLIEFLAEHGISSVAEELQGRGKTIGQAILGYAIDAKADLVVMGAFGHSRLTEFILGGATRELLETSTIPLFMSH